MKVKDLVRALSAADPESKVIFYLGERDADIYRIMCAKAEIMSEDCLTAMESIGIHFSYDEGEKEPFLVEVYLRHSNVISTKELHEYVDAFNDLYNKESNR